MKERTAVRDYKEMPKIAREIRRARPGMKARIVTKKILFLKTTGNLTGGTRAKVTPIRFPFYVLHPEVEELCYILEVDKPVWDASPKHVKNMLMLHEFLHIPEGGCDPDSNQYRKTVPHDIEDHSVILALAADVDKERLHWCHPDANFPDILEIVERGPQKGTGSKKKTRKRKPKE